MPKTLFSAMFCLGLLIPGLAAVYAQAPSAQPEVIVRQGDTIQWNAASSGIPHKVRFGANGATSVADINAILENFSPALTPGSIGDSPQDDVGRLLSAKVKDDAQVGATFVFTCGVHPAQMLSLQFTVAAKVEGQPARTHRIAGESGLHWHLHIDTTPPAP